MRMKRYKNLNGDSGVCAYEIKPHSITAAFHNRIRYLYDYQSAGAANVEEMKNLAAAGRGLSAFISRVMPRYAARSRE